MTVAVPVRHTGVLANSMHLECTSRFGSDAIDVHGAVAALSSDILVQWVPSYSLHVVEMLCNLVYTFS